VKLPSADKNEIQRCSLRRIIAPTGSRSSGMAARFAAEKGVEGFARGRCHYLEEISERASFILRDNIKT